MRAKLHDFKTGWFGVSLELLTGEIDGLIQALQELKERKDHFHFRSSFDHEAGIGDVEISWAGDDACGDLELEAFPPVYPDD